MSTRQNIKTGILLGIIAGIIDVIPMIIQNLAWNANLSAFSMWVVIGFILSITNLKISVILRSILISFLILVPNLFIIGWAEPLSLFPIIIMTLILSTLLGFVYSKVAK